MRIALLTHTRRRVGGVEGYLETLTAGLAARGHAVALASEIDDPAHRAPIRLPADAAELPLREDGGKRSLAALREWQPDVVFTHGLLDPGLEAQVLTEFPASVGLMHGYYGACISGHKAWSAPGTPRPCGRPFGAGCLLHYYPHRCGGLDPRAMWRDFRRQSRRRRLLGRYGARVVFSEHLAREYAGLGLTAEVLPRPPGDEPTATPGAMRPSPPSLPVGVELRLFFLGRMEPLKGGATLLEAAAELLRVEAADAPWHRLRLDFAGQGSAETRWREQGAALEARFPGRCTVRFHGWLDAVERDERFAKTHLLVVPSLWPEPLGLVGAEAAARGVPAVGFAVGGIPEWLRDGVNGVLAPGDPPTPGGLATAIRRATTDPATYAALRAGAERSVADPAGRAERHFAAVEAVCRRVAGMAPVG